MGHIDDGRSVLLTVFKNRAASTLSVVNVVKDAVRLQASVADAYFHLRGLDAQAQLLDRSVEAFTLAYDLTAKRRSGGIGSGMHVNPAKPVLGNARAQVSTIANQRAATKHEITALVGQLASDFALPANVRIGVARVAFCPSLSLGPAGGRRRAAIC